MRPLQQRSCCAGRDCLGCPPSHTLCGLINHATGDAANTGPDRIPSVPAEIRVARDPVSCVSTLLAAGARGRMAWWDAVRRGPVRRPCGFHPNPFGGSARRRIVRLPNFTPSFRLFVLRAPDDTAVMGCGHASVRGWPGRVPLLRAPAASAFQSTRQPRWLREASIGSDPRR